MEVLATPLRKKRIILHITWQTLYSLFVKRCKKTNWSELFCNHFPAGIYLFKVNNKITRTWCEICSKLTIKTPKRRQCRRSVFFFYYRLGTYFTPCSSVSIVNFEQVIAGWVCCKWILMWNTNFALLTFLRNRGNVWSSSGYRRDFFKKNSYVEEDWK